MQINNDLLEIIKFLLDNNFITENGPSATLRINKANNYAISAMKYINMDGNVKISHFSWDGPRPKKDDLLEKEKMINLSIGFCEKILNRTN